MIPLIHKSTRPQDFLRRALVVVLISTVVCLVVWMTNPKSPYPLSHGLVYSYGIGLCSWALIDLGRFFVKRPQGNDWPVGWRAFALPGVGVVAGLLLGSTISSWILGHPVGGWMAKTPRALAGQLFFSFLIGVTISYFFWTRGRSLHLEKVIEESRREAAEAQLRLLQSQLEPHMLFNTLANLHVLIGTDPQRAQAMLDRLIAFLRSTLVASRATQHPLSTEFARTADYLALMKIRMGDRLDTVLDLPDELGSLPVPPLVLQPLVENAIKHGLEPHVAGGRLTVQARRDGQHVELTVRDTGAGLAQPDGNGSHFGLEQVRQRLSTLYGDQASLTLEAAKDHDGGALARVRLPIGEPR